MKHLTIILFIFVSLFLSEGTALFGQITLMVTSTGDDVTYPYTNGELRWAVGEAGAYTGGGTITIKFNLPSDGMNPVVINLNKTLSLFENTTIIDGTSQPGYQTGNPTVIIHGTLIPNTAMSTAFYFEHASHSKVLGLYIRNFYDGIVFDYGSTYCEANYNVINQNTHSNITIKSSDHCTVKGNFINTDVNLTHFTKNSEEGIFISNHTNDASNLNIIGGILCGEGNTIAYTRSEGIDNDPNLGAAPSQNASNIYTGNIIFDNALDAIELRDAANVNKNAPTILTTGCITTGIAEPGDIVELFGCTGPAGSKKNANQYMKTVVADAFGNWTVNFDFIEYPFITATARGSRYNTSELAPAKAITPSVLNFTYQLQLCLGEAITFDNISTSCAQNVTFEWDFGDGSGPSSVGTHTYTPPGVYTVKLTMLPAIYCKVYTVTKTIAIANCCNKCKTLDFLVPSVCVNDTAKFSNTSVCFGNPNFIWNFGDNTTPSSSGIHTYTVAGTYNVKLTVPGFPAECPEQVITKTITVSNCNPPCKDCIGSFAPEAGVYILGAWVKDDTNNPNELTYINPEIYIDFPTTSNPSGPFSAGPVGPFKAEGEIIDGWQRIETPFTILNSATYINLRLQCASGNCFFDDIRVFPVDGSMKSYVYDPTTLRLMAELDERNYATLYEYDEEGKLVRVKKETEKGIMTIKENKNSSKKRQ